MSEELKSEELISEEQKTIFKDANGKLSSKRIVGIPLIISGAALLLGAGIASIFRALADTSSAIQCGIALISAGSALIGIGTFEHKDG